TIRQLAEAFANLQQLRSASDLSAEIDRRMAVLRLVARDVVAEGSGDPGSSLAQTDLLAGLLASARPGLAPAEQDMVAGMSRRLATYRTGLVELVGLAKTRKETLARLNSAAATSDKAIADWLDRLVPGGAATEATRSAAQLVAAERQTAFAFADPGGFDPNAV